jgi:chromosome segregation ATPase
MMQGHGPRSTIAAMRIALVVMVLAGAGLVAGCGGSDENNSDEASSTMEWADDLCSAVSTWTSSISSAGETLQRSGLTEDGLDDAVNDVKSATDTLLDDIGDLGKPDTQAGAQAQQSLEQLSTDLEQDVDSIQAATKDVSSLSELLQAAPAVSTSLATMDTQVRSTVKELEGLDPEGELKSAFEQASACDDLSSSSS